MEISEDIETINSQLASLFGIDISSARPMFRVSWSEDQREQRFGTWEDFTASGVFVRRVTEARTAPKYSWIKERYVLERLVAVPEANQAELCGAKVSYEPVWVFRASDGKYLPPRLDVCQVIINTLYAALGKKKVGKFVDPEAGIEAKSARVDKIMEELFGNETSEGDALAQKSGVGYTGPSLIKLGD